MKIFRSCLLLCLFFSLNACGTPSHFIVRDSVTASKIKKVAVLPFQNTNRRTTDDPTKKKFRWSYTKKFLKKAEKRLSKRYHFISQEEIKKELERTGFQGKEGREEASGYSIAQAMVIGRNLGADALFLCSVASWEKKPKFAISVRLLDVKTGKVILAASAACSKHFGSQSYYAPVKKLVKRFEREAP